MCVLDLYCLFVSYIFKAVLHILTSMLSIVTYVQKLGILKLFPAHYALQVGCLPVLLAIELRIYCGSCNCKSVFLSAHIR